MVNVFVIYNSILYVSDFCEIATYPVRMECEVEGSGRFQSATNVNFLSKCMQLVITVVCQCCVNTIQSLKYHKDCTYNVTHEWSAAMSTECKMSTLQKKKQKNLFFHALVNFTILGYISMFILLHLIYLHLLISVTIQIVKGRFLKMPNFTVLFLFILCFYRGHFSCIYITFYS